MFSPSRRILIGVEPPLPISGDWTLAQFYIRRINNSDLANAQTLWLGIKTERKLNNREAVLQLADQLRKRFAQSTEAAAYEKGSFNE